MTAEARKPRRPVRETTYEQLRAAILMGMYKPGDWLREEEVSRNLGISRMPVREAFRKLEQDRFLEHFPNRGARVTEVFTEDLAEIYDARIFVECRLTRKAAERITPDELRELERAVDAYAAATEGPNIVRLAREFHDLIFKASRCESLVAVSAYISSLIVRIRHHNHLDPARRPDSLVEHLAIYDALERRNPDLAEAAVRRHLESSKTFSLAKIKSLNAH